MFWENDIDFSISFSLIRAGVFFYRSINTQQNVKLYKNFLNNIIYDAPVWFIDLFISGRIRYGGSNNAKLRR